jgi:hypothetical protein
MPPRKVEQDASNSREAAASLCGPCLPAVSFDSDRAYESRGRA